MGPHHLGHRPDARRRGALLRQGLGRWFAIAAIIINGIGQIAWFPAYPLWSLLAIGLEIAVLYALTAGWKEARDDLRG